VFCCSYLWTLCYVCYFLKLSLLLLLHLLLVVFALVDLLHVFLVSLHIPVLISLNFVLLVLCISLFLMSCCLDFSCFLATFVYFHHFCSRFYLLPDVILVLALAVFPCLRFCPFLMDVQPLVLLLLRRSTLQVSHLFFPRAGI
jgi:hypothetical protein